MDGKGRIAVPARHRELLNAAKVTQLTITKHPEGALMIFPQPNWEPFRARVQALPMDSMGWKRMLLGNAMEVEIDAASRVLVPPELRKSASLDRDVLLLGMGPCFELWDAPTYEAYEARVRLSPMPESLKNFSI